MTILGRHTVAETRAFGKAVDFRMKKTEEAFQTIPDSYKQSNPARYGKLVQDWTKAKDDWRSAWSDVQNKLALIMAATGVATPEDIVPSEDQYTKLVAQTAQGGRNKDDSEYMTRRYVEEITGKQVDFTGQPSQMDTWDVDMGAYKKVDGAIKAGEKTAGDMAKSKTGLYIGLGVAGTLAAVVAAKVYL